MCLPDLLGVDSREGWPTGTCANGVPPGFETLEEAVAKRRAEEARCAEAEPAP